MSPLHLAVLGPPELQREQQTLAFPTRKVLALLIYLALEPGWQPREKLIALLWPTSDDKRGRGALRTTLVHLRRLLETTSAAAPCVLTQEDKLILNPDLPLTIDTTLVEQALKTPRLHQLQTAVAVYRGPFLEAFSLIDSPAFDDWSRWQREQWHQRLTLILDQLAQQQLERQESSAALQTINRWLVHDPLDETAHRRLIELHALTGNRAAAQQAYDYCRQLLNNELGLAPSTATEALMQRIRHGRMATLAQRPPASSPLLSNTLPFIGRAAEHSHLANCYQQLHTGQTQAVLIQGEPGIGKTRLAQSFLTWANLQGADLLTGRAFEASGRLPYQPLIDALRPRLEAENAPDDLLDDVWLAELSRLLPELRERYPDLPLPLADDTTAATRLPEAITRLLHSLAQRQTVVLFIDDVQWADAATLDVLLYSGRYGAEKKLPIFLLLTLRSESLAIDMALNDWLNNLSRQLPLTRLILNPLNSAETQQLAQRWQETQTHSTPDPTNLGQWLYQETAGQPFFISETLKALQEDAAAPWSGQPSLLPTVRQLILTRLQRLTPPASALLAAAAVLGRPSTFEQLYQLTDLTADEALTALDELLPRQLLLETAALLPLYTFSHDKIRDVVYTEAGDARRRLYHQRAFMALQAVDAPLAVIAHHALAARLPEPAYRYTIRAADEAMQLFAIRDAIAHYERARQISTQTPLPKDLLKENQPHLLAQLSRAYELTGDLVQAQTIGRAMLELARASDAAAMVCAALNRLAGLAIYTNQLATAVAYLQEAREIATAQHLTRWLAEAEWNLAQLRQHQYDLAAAKLHSQRAFALARELNDAPLMAGTLNNLAYAHLLLGELDEMLSVMREAHGRYVALNNRALEADCLTGMGGAYIFKGQFREGIQLAQQALALYKEVENPWGILFSSGWLAAGLLDAGQFEAALQTSQTITPLVKELGTTPVSIWNRLWLGNAWRALLNLDAAVAAHQQAAQLNAAHPLPAFAEYIAAELCTDYVLLGDWPKAYTYAQETLVQRHYAALPQIVLARWPITAALCRAGEITTAAQDCQQAAPLLSQLPRFHIGHLQAQATLAQVRGATKQAIALLERALNLAQEMNILREQWSVLAQLTELYQEEQSAQQGRRQTAVVIDQLAAAITDPTLRESFLAAAVTNG